MDTNKNITWILQNNFSETLDKNNSIIYDTCLKHNYKCYLVDIIPFSREIRQENPIQNKNEIVIVYGSNLMQTTKTYMVGNQVFLKFLMKKKH